MVSRPSSVPSSHSIGTRSRNRVSWAARRACSSGVNGAAVNPSRRSRTSSRADSNARTSPAIAAAIAGDVQAFESARDEVRERLDGFTAAPFTPEEQARRAAQLTRFLELVPVEWDHGTEDGRLTVPFEMQEMTAFIDAAQSALDDLEPELDQRDPRP